MHQPSLTADNLDISYGGPQVVAGLTTEIITGRISVIAGANGCGKSTLLRAFGRLLTPEGGSVILDGKDIQQQPTKSVARRLSILPQSPTSPDGVVVRDLVRRGRYPHQRLFDQWSATDERAVDRAMDLTRMTEFADRPIDELSGGQRQRAWIAMSLAQDTPLMLLDEPTTFLDIAHQMEILDLLAELNDNEGRIVMVLHDLNQACRYADHLITMADGRIEAQGSPAEIVHPGLIERVFGLACKVVDDPVTGTPLFIPLRRQASQKTRYGRHQT